MESWYWLNDYALYMALKFHFDNQEWLAWPEDIRFRKRDAVERYKEELKEEIDFWKMCIRDRKNATYCKNLSQGGFKMEIRRDFYLNKLIKRKNNGMIKVITGIRRC